MSEITIDAIARALKYDPDTGKFTRTVSCGRRKAGEDVGSIKPGVGVIVGVLGKHFLAHRLAWFLTYGEWPGRLQHIDHNLQNNAIANIAPEKACNGELTAARLREVLDYSPITGDFYWKETRGRSIRGEIAGCIHSLGYVDISVDGALYKAHRLAWLYVHGQWPSSEIDHRNGVRDDNRIENLREASRTENMQNKRAYRSSSSIGACFHKSTGRWAASIQANGRRRHLGLFDSKDEAFAAYEAAKLLHHKFQPKIRENALTKGVA